MGEGERDIWERGESTEGERTRDWEILNLWGAGGPPVYLDLLRALSLMHFFISIWSEVYMIKYIH